MLEARTEAWQENRRSSNETKRRFQEGGVVLTDAKQGEAPERS